MKWKLSNLKFDLADPNLRRRDASREADERAVAEANSPEGQAQWEELRAAGPGGARAIDGDPVVDWLISQFERSDNVDLSTDPIARQRLREAADKARIELETAQEAQINLPFIAGMNHLDTSLTRAKLNELNA